MASIELSRLQVFVDLCETTTTQVSAVGAGFRSTRAPGTLAGSIVELAGWVFFCRLGGFSSFSLAADTRGGGATKMTTSEPLLEAGGFAPPRVRNPLLE